MAIAGLQNVSVFDSSFLRDSHSQSPRRRGNGGSGSTRSSSILQMWRELEDEHVVSQAQGRPGEGLLQQRSDELSVDLSQANTPNSHERGQRHVLEDTILGENDCETWSQSQSQHESHDEQEELNNSSCDNSSDFGEVERERVRQIFREWMNTGGRDDHASSNISQNNNSSRSEWLGETEQERVRIIREWVQLSSQQRVISSGDNREEQTAEMGTQIERVRDGFSVNQSVGQIEHTRRGLRKICGRQVLLDMLKKAEMERQREVQELLGHRAVSHFPHRNRIQALLRGRFLRNDRSVDINRSTSIAESELGLLRQKQTVSGLREGFFSRKDDSGGSQVTCNMSDTSSNSGIDANSNEQTEASSLQTVPSVHFNQSEPNDRGGDRFGISDDQNCIQGTIIENLDCPNSAAHVESRDCQSSSSVEMGRRDGSGQNIVGMTIENTAIELMQQNFQSEHTEHSVMHELSEAYHEQAELTSNDDDGLSTHSNDMEGNMVVDENRNESTSLEGQQQEELIENEGSDGHQSNVEWRNSTEESVDDNPISGTANEWPQNILSNEDGENSHPPEVPEIWQEDGGFQEAVENWLGGPSDHEVAPVGRIHGFYFPDDDNVNSVELRELLNRRSVSNLLRSSFRDSLDQLIQSYVERQGHAHVEWELQETIPSSASVEQDLEQQNRDQIVGQEHAINSPLDQPSSPARPQPVWERQSHHDNWPQADMNNQRLGIEWEIVNDLRIDMARLQQRMNNMQRMLEACMDMQLELQRSIRQEVSAALNRSAGSSEMHDHDSPDDKSKWECVRKGLCCICCESNIDSLLYRCGHMCTCSKCANELFQSGRKCPMCQAPVVEVIRAYSIL
ncbi:E3 ubiquitin-protein ligase NEURL1B [Senna tora]|uniref:E3 ubiquitin-protein ligase NEURL1B n=1 Tax=Senna tora TaxID=362788 RepID=A0A834TL56_9FABA|nr:E3 ubiquitin-protein ligase NEURL1B [Senna tora]